MNLDLQTTTAHADGFFHLMAIDDELLRLDQQQALVVGNVDGLGGFHHALHIDGRHFLVTHDDHAGAVLATDVAAGDAGPDAADLAIGHQLRLFERLLDGLHGGIDVDHDAALEAMTGRHAEASQTQVATGHDLGHDCHHFGSADVQPDDQIFVFLSHGLCG